MRWRRRGQGKSKVDLGGGTFDSVLMTSYGDEKVVVRNIGGDTHLGGQDWDSRIMKMTAEINE